MKKTKRQIFDEVNIVVRQKLRVNKAIEKIHEIIEKNKDKYITHVFLVSQDIWEEIYGDVDDICNAHPFYGFHIYWHSNWKNMIFFGELHQLAEISGDEMLPEMTKQLEEIAENNKSGVS